MGPQRPFAVAFKPERSIGEGSAVDVLAESAIVKDQHVPVNLGGTSATLFYLASPYKWWLLVGTSSNAYVGDLVEPDAHPFILVSRGMVSRIEATDANATSSSFLATASRE